MAQKRYSIVRVDNMCPRSAEDNNNYCPQTEIDNFWCPDCRFFKKNYGDTKEQLIRKVATGIEIAINEYEKGNIPKGKENRRCAEIIVEFLGVK